MRRDVALQSVEAFYRRIYWECPSSVTRQAAGYALSYSGTSWLYSVNQLWLLDLPSLSDDQLVAALKEAKIFFQPFHADHSIFFTELLTSDAVERLDRYQCTERSRTPLLALEGKPQIAFLNSDLQIVRVTEQNKGDFTSMLRETFYLGPELSTCIVRPDQLHDPAIRHYLGYLDNDAVCCATIILCEGGVASLWNVGTIADFRRQGTASAIVAYALADAAKDGYEASTLLASTIGRPLYESMGYHLIGYNYCYSAARFTGG